MTRKTTDFDVIIIGGGPGGLSAAFWCAELGLSALLLEKEDEFGGQLLRTFNAIKNHLGVEAANGRELRDIFLRQVENREVTRRCGCPVIAANLVEKTVVLADGSRYSAGAIIIATGVSRRRLGIPGEMEFYGRGVLESGKKSESEVVGKRVLIVGGGDAALENALILSRTAANVFVIHRRTEFSARAEFAKGAASHANVELMPNAVVLEILGNDAVEAVKVKDVVTGTVVQIPVDVVLIRVGVVPNTEVFGHQINLDAAGYVVCDGKCLTSLPHVFAVGDVANPLGPTVSAAVGMSATAAKVIAETGG